MGLNPSVDNGNWEAIIPMYDFMLRLTEYNRFNFTLIFSGFLIISSRRKLINKAVQIKSFLLIFLEH